jgi:hypothetical protein
MFVATGPTANITGVATGDKRTHVKQSCFAWSETLHEFALATWRSSATWALLTMHQKHLALHGLPRVFVVTDRLLSKLAGAPWSTVHKPTDGSRVSKKISFELASYAIAH